MERKGQDGGGNAAAVSAGGIFPVRQAGVGQEPETGST